MQIFTNTCGLPIKSAICNEESPRIVRNFQNSRLVAKPRPRDVSPMICRAFAREIRKFRRENQVRRSWRVIGVNSSVISERTRIWASAIRILSRVFRCRPVPVVAAEGQGPRRRYRYGFRIDRLISHLRSPLAARIASSRLFAPRRKRKPAMGEKGTLFDRVKQPRKCSETKSGEQWTEGRDRKPRVHWRR